MAIIGLTYQTKLDCPDRDFSSPAISAVAANAFDQSVDCLAGQKEPANSPEETASAAFS